MITDLKVAEAGWVILLARNKEEVMRLAVLLEDLHLHVRFGAGGHIFGDMHHIEIDKFLDEYPIPREILYTQNPVVFDCLTFESAEDVRARILVVRDGKLENLTEDQANEVWRAYEVGVEHVSEILRTRGLW